MTDGNSVYDDTDAMLAVSNLLYAVASLNRNRDRVPEDQIKDPNFLENLPKPASEVLGWFKGNYELLSSSEKQKQFDLKVVEDILSRDEKDEISGEASLEVLDDKFAFKGETAEVVYGITKNPDKKRLTIVFRGSIEDKDWEQNFKTKGKELELDPEKFKGAIPNINSELFEGFEKCQCHSGFYEYLFELQQQNDKTTKYEEILNEVMTRLKDPSCEGYSVFVTGHSLGASLATLMACALALSNDVPLPVKLITFASPHVGKVQFVKAFENLEEKGRIQHLRVTNDDDLTPQVMGPLGYKHTGIHLNLYGKSWFSRKTHTLRSSKVRGFWLWTNDMSLSLSWLWGTKGAGINHKLSLHGERLERAKDDLKKETLNDLYKNPKLREFNCLLPESVQ